MIIRKMSYLVIILLTVFSISMVYAQQKHANVFREMLQKNPLDLWSGKPSKPYKIIGKISVGEEQNKLSGYHKIDSVVIRMMKNAVAMKADAIINIQCGAHKFINDNGDFFDKEPWAAIWVRPLYCRGTAVKYKKQWYDWVSKSIRFGKSGSERFHMAEENKCVFCKSSVTSNFSQYGLLENYKCAICGKYFIDDLLADQIGKLDEGDSSLLNCISENIRINSERMVPCWIRRGEDNGSNNLPKNMFIKYFEDYKNEPIIHANKPNDILKMFATKLNSQGPFTPVHLNPREMFALKIKDQNELNEWCAELQRQKIVKLKHFASTLQPDYANHNTQQCIIEPAGWLKINELYKNVVSQKVFIAMWFGNPERAKIQESIEHACKETGWDAFTIDNEEFMGGITDEIIAKINQSKFVIAEFTGNRHGVYYEAGYAEGKGIPVIYVIKKENADELHFDTRHLNHITWESFDDLKNKLKNRIGAVINK